MLDPKYFPIDRGVYEVGPGLKNLGTDLGQGEFDKKVFQIDSQFQIARDNKILCLKEDPAKYVLRHDLPEHGEAKVARTILNLFLIEYPEKFNLKDGRLDCLHTGDVIRFDANDRLVSFESRIATPKPSTLLDALMLQVQEDLAITRRTDPETDFLAYLHLCSASHWSPAEKIGRNFIKVHETIPGNDKLVKASKNLVEAMINKGPFVRFVWSFVTDTRLNHHPEPPPGQDPVAWKGRSFNHGSENPFFLRVERQVTFGVPEESLSIFTIRVSFIPGTEIKSDPKWREQMRSALLSMTPESRVYKGVAGCFEELIQFLS